MLAPLDYVVIVVYVIGVAALGLYAGGRQKSVEDYFLGSRQLPWWAVSLSIVATETSTLTVLGVPAVAYGGSFVFLQLAIGYILGRFVVAAFFIPAYFRGEITTAYGLLSNRFGSGMRVSASGTFMITRLLADGVRLFATAIPVKIIADAAGFDHFVLLGRTFEVTYTLIIVVLAFVTILYTLIGGLRAVVWMDVLQLIIYVLGAVLAIGLLLTLVSADWMATARDLNKMQLFDFDSSSTLRGILTSPYAAVTAVLGGAVFSMASHGTDHLIVQRLLACKNQRDSQKALVASAFIVLGQFALFLFLGLLLWSFYGGQDVANLGLSRPDEVFPFFIVEEMPAGLAGLLLAAIVAAAMSSLSSSLSALASATWNDFISRIKGQKMNSLLVSRIVTLIWGLIFIFFASLFESTTEPVVVLGLSIAAYTYGGLLGVFLLGIFSSRANERDAIISFFATIVIMATIILTLRTTSETGWIFSLNVSSLDLVYNDVKQLAWPWYTTFGALLGYTIGSLLSLTHSEAPTNQTPD
ncbi:MAG: sodium/solute symporter [Rhodothermales bacterium]|nr:sodium/solute symporter [Rhodothermales bacterium]